MHLITILLIVPSILSAPKSRSTATFDQKQTGDYNIQLHLKDFHIIAVVGDDSLSSLGDYDYNYDYTDLTVKPPLSTSSSKPEKPTEKPTEKPSEKPIVSSTSLKTTETTLKPVVSSTTEKMTLSPESTIKVEVVNENETNKIGVRKTEIPVQSLAIVPVEDFGNYNGEQQEVLGEILHYRKCSSGFARDKRGRCRKIRRPSSSLPFGITRFASNLAAKFRQAVSEDSPSSTDSTQD